MNLNKSKVMKMIDERMARMEKTLAEDQCMWRQEVDDYFKDQVNKAKSNLEKAKAELARAKSAGYRPEEDEELNYSLSRSRPKDLPEVYDKLKDLRAVLEAVEEESIKVSPQIERALGLKW